MRWEDWPLEPQEASCFADVQVPGRKIHCGGATAAIVESMIPQSGYDLLCILWGMSKTPLIPRHQEQLELEQRIVTEFARIGLTITVNEIYRARDQAIKWNLGHRITLL